MVASGPGRRAGHALSTWTASPCRRVRRRCSRAFDPVSALLLELTGVSGVVTVDSVSSSDSRTLEHVDEPVHDIAVQFRNP